MHKTLLFCFIFAICLAAAPEINGKEDPVRITHGPWLCEMSENAVTIVWKTDKPGLSWVEAGEDTGEHFYAEEHKRFYDSRHGRRRTQETLHSVRLSGLKPGTVYNYRIFTQQTVGWDYSDYVKLGKTASSSVYKTEPYKFRTFPSDTDRVRFIVINDLHGRDKHLRKLCENVDFSQYDFVALNGDMLSMTESEEDLFSGWLDACVSLFATNTPIVFIRGNHENRGRYADSLFEYFPSSSGRFYYNFHFGNIDFLVLDCGEDKPDSDIEYGGIAEFDQYREEEALWLEETVQNLSGKYKVAFLHIPPGTSSWHGDKELRRLFMPPLSTFGIDLMISGHTHSFMELKPDKSHPFPIVVNDNNCYMSVHIKSGRTTISIVDSEGRQQHKLEYKKQ